MNKSLDSIFTLIERQREDLLREVRALSPDQFNAHPPGKWSINQVLAHVITGERMSLQYVKKKVLAVNDVPDTGLYEEAKMLLLKISQRMPALKFKAPRVVVEMTPSYEGIQQLEADWSKLRAEWRTFLETLPDEYVKRKIYKHVVAGRLNTKHALLFFREHIIHHMPQIRSLMAYR